MISIKTLTTAEQKKTGFGFALTYSSNGEYFLDGLGERMYFCEKESAEKFCKAING